MYTWSVLELFVANDTTLRPLKTPVLSKNDGAESLSCVPVNQDSIGPCEI